MQTRSAIHKVALSASLIALLQLSATGFAADQKPTDTKAKVEDQTHGSGNNNRPPRPGNVKQMVEEFKQQKEKFLSMRKDAQSAAKDERSKVREDINSGAIAHARNEAQESVEQAKEAAREHARKIAEEAKEAASGHRRD